MNVHFDLEAIRRQAVAKQAEMAARARAKARSDRDLAALRGQELFFPVVVEQLLACMQGDMEGLSRIDIGIGLGVALGTIMGSFMRSNAGNPDAVLAMLRYLERSQQSTVDGTEGDDGNSVGFAASFRGEPGGHA